MTTSGSEISSIYSIRAEYEKNSSDYRTLHVTQADTSKDTIALAGNSHHLLFEKPLDELEPTFPINELSIDISGGEKFEEHTIQLDTDGVQTTIHIVDAFGKPITDACIHVRKTYGSIYTHKCLKQSEEAFTFKLLSNRYSFRISQRDGSDFGAQEYQNITHLDVESGSLDLTFSLPIFQISGTLIDKVGNPVSRAEVSNFHSGDSFYVGSHSYTDKYGRFSIYGATSSDYMEIYIENYLEKNSLDYFQNIDLANYQSYDNISVVLDDWTESVPSSDGGAQISGTITSTGGNVLSGFKVQLLEENSGFIRQTYTDSDGRYTLSTSPGSKFQIAVSAKVESTSTNLTAKSPNFKVTSNVYDSTYSSEVNLQVPISMLSFNVMDINGNGVPGINIEVEDPRYYEWNSYKLDKTYSFTHQPFTPPSGKMSFASNAGHIKQLSISSDDSDNLLEGKEYSASIYDVFGDVTMDIIYLGYSEEPVDNDLDGLPDHFENYYGGTLNADEDIDGDGLSNLHEYLNGSHPLLSDYDGDGISDKEDIYPSIHTIFSEYSTELANFDTDSDGWINAVESFADTDHANAEDLPKRVTDDSVQSDVLQLCIMEVIPWFSFVKEITELECRLSDTSDNNDSLAGLETYTNLKHLYLDGFSALDTSPLSQLINLERLAIKNHKIEDLTFLDTLSNITYLDFEGYQQSKAYDLSPLGELKSLKYLSLSGTGKETTLPFLEETSALRELHLRSLGDVSADVELIDNHANLENLTLESLGISYINLNKGFNIKTLRLSDLKVSDLTFLKNLESLEQLDISHLTATTLPADLNLQNLLKVSLKDVPIVDLSSLEHSKEITHFSLIKVASKYLPSFVGFDSLSELYVKNTPIIDLSPLENLVGLENLTLINVKAKELPSLGNAKSLTEIRLERFELENLEGLSEVYSLEKLWLQYVPVSDLGPLTYLTNLETVYLVETRIDNYIGLYRENYSISIYSKHNQYLHCDDPSGVYGNNWTRVRYECLIDFTDEDKDGIDDSQDEDLDNDGLLNEEDPEPNRYTQRYSQDLTLNIDGKEVIALFQLGYSSSYLKLFDKKTFEYLGDLSSRYSGDYEISLFEVGDVNGDGNDDVGIFTYVQKAKYKNGVYSYHKKPQLIVYEFVRHDYLDKIRTFNWPANWESTSLLKLDDLNGDGHAEIGLQGLFRDGNMKPQLMVKDGLTSENYKKFSYPSLFSESRYTQLSDVNGDGVRDIGLVGTYKRHGKSQVKVINSQDSSDRMTAYNFPLEMRDTTWFELGDINFDGVSDFGLFGTLQNDGRWKLMTKSGESSKESLGNYLWPSDIIAPQFLIIPDMNGDGVNEFAVAGYRSSIDRFQIIIKSGTDRHLRLAGFGWPNTYSEVSFEVLGDLSGDGISEIALYGKDLDGNYTLDIKEGTGTPYKLITTEDYWTIKPTFQCINCDSNSSAPYVLLYGTTTVTTENFSRSEPQYKTYNLH